MTRLGILFSMVLLCGCVTERRVGIEFISPWPEADAPVELVALAEDIAAYQAATGWLPDNLAAIDKLGISSHGPYAERGYAYHPAGIGILREGWRVIAADDRIRKAGGLWCVLRTTMTRDDISRSRVAFVPLHELK